MCHGGLTQGKSYHVSFCFFNTIQKPLNLKLVADDVVQKLSEQDSEHFQRYKCLMALDFEDDFGRAPADEELWNQMSELPSFLAKKALPKPSRWFAWHECAHQQLKEFFATRCLLHWYFEDEGLPAPEEVTTQFQKCKGDLGGLKLLHRALTYVNHQTACIMLLVSRPCWTWYTEQISEIKIPQQGVEQLMTWALSWYKDDHLLAIVKTLYDWRSLKTLSYYQVHQGRNDDDDLAATVFKYASNVLSRRLWTMSRYGTARECFVGLVSSCVDHRQEAMGVMRRDWRLLNLADVLQLSLTCNSCPAPLSGYRVPFSSRVAGTKQVFLEHLS